MEVTLEAYINKDCELIVTKKDGNNIYPGEEYPQYTVDFLEHAVSREIETFETFKITIEKI